MFVSAASAGNIEVLFLIISSTLLRLWQILLFCLLTRRAADHVLTSIAPYELYSVYPITTPLLLITSVHTYGRRILSVSSLTEAIKQQQTKKE